MRRHVPCDIAVLAVINGKTRFDLTCLGCGGCEQELRGDLTTHPHVHCKACGGWLGAAPALAFKAGMKARDMGMSPDLEPFLAQSRAAVEENRMRREADGD